MILYGCMPKLFKKLTPNYNLKLISLASNPYNSTFNLPPNAIIRNLCEANFCLKKKSISLLNFNHKYFISTSTFLPRKFNPKTAWERNENIFKLDDEIFMKAHLPLDKWSSINDKTSDKLRRKFDQEVFDTFILKKCSIARNQSLASSYFDYLKSRGQTLNYLAHSYYLISLGQNIDNVDWNIFYSSFTELQKFEPFPNVLLVNIVNALSYTKMWEDSDKYVKRIEESGLTPGLAIELYNIMARAFLKHKNIEAAFEYLKMKSDPIMNTIDLKSFLNDETIINMMKSVNNSPEGYSPKNLITFLKVLEHFNTALSQANAEILSTLIQRNWKSNKIIISNRMKCKSCKAQLKEIPCDEDSIRNLKVALENNVVKGKDIFHNTTPEEWQNFIRFLNINPPFDVVADGLNLFLSHANRTREHKKKAMQSFVNKYEGNNVLIIARFHMRESIIKMFGSLNFHRSVKYYFLNDITKDDSFILYAALNSGLGCKFITSDFLRNHKILMGDKELERQFINWQSSHQVLFFTGNGNLVFKQPYQYHQTTQWNEETRSWHIPLESPVKLEYMNSSENWLCLSEISGDLH